MRNPQFVRKNGARLGVEKTYKLFIGGKFVRSESGRVLTAPGNNAKAGANYSRASRKDFRDAVTAAKEPVIGSADRVPRAPGTTAGCRHPLESLIEVVAKVNRAAAAVISMPGGDPVDGCTHFARRHE